MVTNARLLVIWHQIWRDQRSDFLFMCTNKTLLIGKRLTWSRFADIFKLKSLTLTSILLKSSLRLNG